MIPGVIEFLVAWVVSTIVIYIAVRTYPRKKEKSDLPNSIIAALLGAIVFTVSTILMIPLGSLIAVMIWLWILKKLFNVSWIGALLIAVIIWILNYLIGMLGIPSLL